MEISLHVHISKTHAAVFQYLWPGSYMHKTKKALSSASGVGAKTSVFPDLWNWRIMYAHIQKAQVLFIQSKTRWILQ